MNGSTTRGASMQVYAHDNMDRRDSVADEVCKLEQCKHSVVKAGMILATRPAVLLIVTLVAVDINEKLMRSILGHGSKDYEFEQDANLARACSANEATSRQFPMVEAALATAEKTAISSCQFWLNDPTVWDMLIKGSQRTVKQRCHTYRLISSVEAQIDANLYRESKTFPTKSFLASHLCCLRLLRRRNENIPYVLCPMSSGRPHGRASNTCVRDVTNLGP